jgi:hypothetical protein
LALSSLADFVRSKRRESATIDICAAFGTNALLLPPQGQPIRSIPVDLLKIKKPPEL